MGRALMERGHTVDFLVNPYYQHQVQEAGINFMALGEYMDLKRVGVDYPDIMHPRKGMKVVLNALLVPTSRAAFERIHQIARTAQRPDAVVQHIICPGAGWACQQLRIPCAHTVLSPLNWVSRHEPIIGAGWQPENPPAWVGRLLRAVMLPIMGRIFDPPLAGLRRELGLSKQRNILINCMRGGALNLAMWSPALRGALPDDPATGVICGFPWHDRHGQVEAPSAEIEEFLNNGEPPILFCLGTAAVHVAGDFYDHAARACHMLGRRGLLLVGPGCPAPRELPQGVRAFSYAPFSAVMPKCALNVHHGGIGSTGQALRAGRPTVVIPHAHDQWDNAARLRRLGVSETLHRSKVNAPRLARVLNQILTRPEAAAKALQLAQMMSGEDGAAIAAEHIERIAST